MVRVTRYMENKGDPVDTDPDHPQLMTARQVAVLLLMRESTVQDYARRDPCRASSSVAIVACSAATSSPQSSSYDLSPDSNGVAPARGFAR